MKWLLLPALTLVVAAGAAAPGASQLSHANAQLGVWQGHWSYSETDYDTPYGHAHMNSGTADCAWSQNRGFIICDYLNRNPGNGVPANDLAVFSYNPATGMYTRIGIFKDGTTFLERLTVQGNTWVASGEIRNKTLRLRTVYTYLPGNRRTAITQISADRGRTWTTTSKFAATQR